ncbi:MAG: hypothetical protein ACRCRZ_00175 [Metamycoplasmataceae bacterium]
MIKKNNLKILQENYKTYKKKYLRSKLIFITLNLVVMTMSASLIALNTLAIKFNNDFREIVPFLVTITILSGIAAFVTTIQTSFNLRNKKALYESQIEAINEYVKKDLKIKELNLKEEGGVSDEEFNDDVHSSLDQLFNDLV